MNTAKLFGIKHANRDFSLPQSWGKNQFNSSFPAALTAFLASKNLDCKYLVLDKTLKVTHQFINVTRLLGQSIHSDDLFYAFETAYTPYQQLVIGSLPRIDLVTQSRKNGICLSALEIKLTALPDNSTCLLSEENYGSELVIRPDTIVYLACSIAQHFANREEDLLHIFGSKYLAITDWTEIKQIKAFLTIMLEDINKICEIVNPKQQAFVLQPIWKTIGKTSKLATNCLDVFVWSNLAFTRLFIDSASKDIKRKKTNISRHTRTLIWLFKMLYDFAHKGQIHYEKIIDTLSYNSKNDKAFALSGKLTNRYMQSEELRKPRICKTEIKQIILGGGQNLLSPERRFDAIVYNTSTLFD